MEQKTVESLYGLKIGDRVKCLLDNTETYGKNFFNKQGQITKILPETAEFHVRFEDVPYQVSFQRVFLLSYNEFNQHVEEFTGQLTETMTMSAYQMRSYLDQYHNLKEGTDFAITNEGRLKEVILTNEKYVRLIKDLFSIESVSKELVGNRTNDFKHTMMPSIKQEGNISLTFNTSDWTFRTHLTPWGIQRSLLALYDLDIDKEWKFK